MPDITQQPSQQVAIPTRQVAIPTEFHWPDGLVTRFANQFTIQISEGVCLLGFYEAVPPVILGAPEEIATQLGKITSIRSEGIARIVISLPKMLEILTAIQGTLSVSSKSPEAETEEAKK